MKTMIHFICGTLAVLLLLNGCAFFERVPWIVFRDVPSQVTYDEENEMLLLKFSVGGKTTFHLRKQTLFVDYKESDLPWESIVGQFREKHFWHTENGVRYPSELFGSALPEEFKMKTDCLFSVYASPSLLVEDLLYQRKTNVAYPNGNEWVFAHFKIDEKLESKVIYIVIEGEITKKIHDRGFRIRSFSRK